MSLYRFDDYQLDPHARRLLRGGEQISVEPRVFDLVVYLIEQRQRAIGRDELIAAAWGRVDSSDATLAQAILKARRLFGDDGMAQRMIRTVARFGYQWVAATTAISTEANASNGHANGLAILPDAAAPDVSVAMPSDGTKTQPAQPSRGRWAISSRIVSLILVAGVVIGASVMYAERPHAPARVEASALTPHTMPGLIFVAPAQVRSAVAQDGWMRLGLMSMSADALRSLPGRSLVPNETVLAVIGQTPAPLLPAHLRTATGAQTVVLIDARHTDDRWQLDATLSAADGTRQLVSAESSEATAAAALLANRLRLAFDGNSANNETNVSPQVFAASARMQAAILEGHAERALAVAAAENSAVNDSPDLIVLRAKAMNRLGRAAEAATAMNALLARVGHPAPAWLPVAYTTLGYSELLDAHFASAEQAFRDGANAAGNDRTETGRAWRGLGNAQAARAAFDDAETSYLRARLELGDDGDRLLLAHIDDDLGSVAGRRGRLDEAIERYLQAATAAAQIGAVELELGARMNIAVALGEQLRHAEALASWRELLPRLQALDFPSMQRYAAVHYATALAETGAFAEARAQLERATAAPAAAKPGALDDVRLDDLRLRLMLGDIGVVRSDAAKLTTASVAPVARFAALALLLRADLAAGDGAAAHLHADLLLNAGIDANRGVRSEALCARAMMLTDTGDDASADADYRDALSLVREGGSPLELREVALPYALFELSHDRLDAARTTASLLGAYADEDFGITLLLARLAADRDPTLAQQLYSRARTLAGARALPPDAFLKPAALAAMPLTTPSRTTSK